MWRPTDFAWVWSIQTCDPSDWKKKPPKDQHPDWCVDQEPGAVVWDRRGDRAMAMGDLRKAVMKRVRRVTG